MNTFLIIAATTVVLLLAVILLARNHKRWLERQSPTGVWQGKDGEAKITLQFEGGPREGTYKQVSESDGNRLKEFGHWSALAHELSMIIMASDVQNHPRFGQETEIQHFIRRSHEDQN